jgi:hypothetical protein
MSSAAVWPDPVANGEDHVEVVIGNATLDRPPAFLLNCQVFLDSCPRLQLSIFEDVPDEEADILLGRLVQLRDKCLGEPHGPFFEPDLDPAGPVF